MILTFFISCFAAWDMPCRYVDMSMWFDVVTATVRNLRRLVGILFTAIFSPFCDGYGREQRDLKSRVYHSSSRIQELSPDIHVPCYGHTGHTHYVSFFTGPSWWRYWETSRILCMMLSTPLKNRIVIGDHHRIFTTLLINLGDIPLLSSFWWQEKPQLCPSSASSRLPHGCELLPGSMAYCNIYVLASQSEVH